MTKDGGGIARPCELCGGDAFLYCDSDSAFLCRSCDAAVHQANFLVARHLRQPLCFKCKSLAGTFVSGAAVASDSLRLPLCRSCTEENPAASSLSDEEEEEDCVSSTESSAVTGGVSKAKMEGTKRVASSSSSIVSDGSGENPNVQVKSSAKRRKTASDSRAEGIFVIWSRRLGLNGNLLVASACQALQACLERLNTTVVLPFRVCLAASFWLGLKMCDRDAATWQNLKRLETVSGVPAKLIVAVERRLARVMRLRKAARLDWDEGWAECDV